MSRHTPFVVCYGDLGRDASMGGYKLHRERVPVGPNRLPRFVEVVTAVIFVLVYLILR